MNLPALFSKPPPQCIEAEMALLGGLILDPAAIPEIMEIVTAGDFFNPSHAEIFSSIVFSYREAGHVDLVLLMNDARAIERLAEFGGVRYLEKLCQETPGPAGCIHWANVVRTHSISRKVIAEASDAIYQAYHARDLEEIQQVAAGAVDRIGRAAKHRDTGVGELLGDAAEAVLADLAAQRRALLPTGMDWFDTVVGGVPESGVLTLLGHPSHGKTTFGLTLMAHLSEGYGGGGTIHSVEQGPKRVAGTLLSVYSGYPVHEWMNRGYQPNEFERMDIRAARERLGKFGLVVEPGAMDAGEIYRRAIHASTKGVRRIMVDYIQDLKPMPGMRNDAEGMAESMRMLARVATDLNMLVIVVSQMDKESRKQNRAPVLNDGRGSGAIGDRTDMGISVYRPFFAEKPESELDAISCAARRAQTEFVIVKNKYGPLGQVTVRFEARSMRFIS